MGYDAEQQKIQRMIAKRGRRKGATRAEIISAYMTGAVETNFRNLPGGDRDSQGWRQERAMYYDNPRNLKASIDRYFDEAIAERGKGLKPGALAQATQQSAFPDRYRERRGEALSLYNRYVGGSAPTARGGPGLKTSLSGQETIDWDGLLVDALLGGKDIVTAITSGTDAYTTATPGKMLTIGGPRGALPGAKSPDAPNGLSRMLKLAEAWDKRKLPYLWGGGHGSRPARPGEAVDCSGYVSAILGISPTVSGNMARSYGKPGRGKHVTVWANDGHVLIQIGRRWFGTSKSNPGGGAGEISAPGKAYLSGFTPRHPRGL